MLVVKYTAAGVKLTSHMSNINVTTLNIPFAKASHVIEDRKHLPALGEIDGAFGESVRIANVYKCEILQHQTTAQTQYVSKYMYNYRVGQKTKLFFESL